MDLADLFKGFSEPIRLRLLHLLAVSKSELCVCDLVTVLDVPQATVSRHLMQLRLQGLVTQRRDGAWMFYKLAQPKAKMHGAILRALKNAAAEDDALANDLERYDTMKNSSTLARCASPGDSARKSAKKPADESKTPKGPTNARR